LLFAANWVAEYRQTALLFPEERDTPSNTVRDCRGSLEEAARRRLRARGRHPAEHSKNHQWQKQARSFHDGISTKSAFCNKLGSA